MLFFEALIFLAICTIIPDEAVGLGNQSINNDIIRGNLEEIYLHRPLDYHLASEPPPVA